MLLTGSPGSSMSGVSTGTGREFPPPRRHLHLLRQTCTLICILNSMQVEIRYSVQLTIERKRVSSGASSPYVPFPVRPPGAGASLLEDRPDSQAEIGLFQRTLPRL